VASKALVSHQESGWGIEPIAELWHFKETPDPLSLVASDCPQHGFDVLLHRNGAALHFVNDLAALLSCEEGLKNAGSRLRQCWRGGCTGLEV